MHLSKKLAVRTAITAMALGAMLATVSAAATGTVTTGSGLRLRSEANTSSSVLASLPEGTSVEILDTVNESWYQVSYEGKTGYVSSAYLSVEEEDDTLYAVVTASSLNLRAQPSTESEKVDSLPMGTTVEVLEEAQDGWYLVASGDLTGYVSGQYLAMDTQSPSYAVVTASSLNVRAEPNSDSEKISSLPSGTQVLILEELDGWLRIEEGYISADYVTIMDGSTTALQAQIVAYAKGFVGCRYVYGAAGPNSFDCSGLAQYVYKHFGYSINRGATSQLKNGVKVSKSELQPGDLVFFNKHGTGANIASHVGIYIGNGQFVHASNSKVGVIISDLYSDYYVKVYTTARRIL